MKQKPIPSQKIQSLLDSMLSDPSSTDDLLGQLNRRGLQHLLQQGLEAEVRQYLDRDRYERFGEVELAAEAAAPRPRAYRNGYTPTTVKTRTDRIPLARPRIRAAVDADGSSVPVTFTSAILAQINRLEVGLKRMTIEMYTRGLSTRDIEETLIDEDGRPLLSRSSISTMTDALFEEHRAFSQRDLSELDVVYLYCDGVYESVRSYTKGQTLLCAWAILSDGRKEMLHLAAVASESEAAWSQFFEEMLQRGLRQPLLVISDGAKGLHAAIHRSFPQADRQRCIAHKLRNIGAKLPENAKKDVHERVKTIYYAASHQDAELLAGKFIQDYASVYPAMVECFSDDLEACLTHLKYPAGHRRFIRTTNLIERAFEEEKRRTKIIPAHQNEKGAVKLVFAVLIRSSKRWTKVSMTDFELTLLRNLRPLKTHAETSSHTQHFISYRIAA